MADTLSMLYATLMVLSSVASVCGNLLLLLVLLLNKELQSDALGLTLSFSLSDLALGLSTIPTGAYNSLFRPDGYASESAFCLGNGFIFLLLQTASLHSLTWATVYKFTEICFALSFNSIWTARWTRVVLVVVWLFCLVNATMPLLGFGGYAYSESRFLCSPSFTPENKYFVLLWMGAGIIVPILTMCSLYGYIIYVARKQARRGTFMCNELHCFYVPASNYLRSSIVMVATSVCLLVCWLPYISVCLYETFSGQQSPAVTAAVSVWLVLTSAAVNPWITCMTQTSMTSCLPLGLQQVQGGSVSKFPQFHSVVSVFGDVPGILLPELRPPPTRNQSHQHSNRYSRNTASTSTQNTNTTVILPATSAASPSRDPWW